MTHELTLLRTIVSDTVSLPGPGRQLDGEETIRWFQNPQLAFQLVDHTTGARRGLRHSGVAAALNLAASFEKRNPAYARGTRRDVLATAIATAAIDAFESRVTDPIRMVDLAALETAVADWFASKVQTRTHVVPCAILLTTAKPFAVGPVRFAFIDDFLKRGTGDLNAEVGQLFYSHLLGTMEARTAKWIAEVEVEGCELAGAEEIANLATDLALVAVQFAIPKSFSRHMARITGRTLPPTVGSVYIIEGVPRPSIHNYHPGHGLASTAFEQFLAANAMVLESVGRRIAHFIRRDATLEKLERAWCDAAYWFHEGLAEPQATIAVAKLETSIEVLFCAENTKLSKARLCDAIQAFYGFGPKDPLPADPSRNVEDFAGEIVTARSRVLHGTFSTLAENVESVRADLEALSFDLLRLASLALDKYAESPTSKDNARAFLSFVTGLRAAQPNETP